MERLRQILLLSRLFSRPKKNQKSGSQGFQKNDERRLRKPQKRFLWKVVFCNTFHASTSVFRSPRHWNFASEIDTKWIANKPEQKWNFKVLALKKLIYTGSKTNPKSNKSCKLPSRVHPAAPTALQRGPEVPRCQNGPPGCSRGEKMVSQNIKMEAPSPQMATPRSQKGPAAEGAALKITF